MGSFVQVLLVDVDTTKVDGKTLILVVDNIEHNTDNGPEKYRLACVKGPLKYFYRWVYITPFPHGTWATLGLETIF